MDFILQLVTYLIRKVSSGLLFVGSLMQSFEEGVKEGAGEREQSRDSEKSL